MFGKYFRHNHSEPILACKFSNKIAIGHPKTIDIYYASGYYSLFLTINHKIIKDLSFLESLNNNHLISSSNNDIQIWEITGNSYKLLNNYQAHDNKIIQLLKLSNNRFASCSIDKTIKIWKKEESITCHKAINLSISINTIYLLNSNMLLSFMQNETMKLYNQEFQYIKEMLNVYCIGNDNIKEFKKDKIIVNGYGLLIINILTFQKETIIYQEDKIYCMEIIDDSNILLGSKKGKIQKFSTNQCKGIKVFVIQENKIKKIIKIGPKRYILIFNNSIFKNLLL